MVDEFGVATRSGSGFEVVCRGCRGGGEKGRGREEALVDLRLDGRSLELSWVTWCVFEFFLGHAGTVLLFFIYSWICILLASVYIASLNVNSKRPAMVGDLRDVD